MALCDTAKSTVAQRFKVKSGAIDKHLAHIAADTGDKPDSTMRRNFNNWVDLGGNLSLTAATKTCRGRRDLALAAPLLARLAQFAELAGKASGALQEAASTTQVQTNVVLMPRSSDS